MQAIPWDLNPGIVYGGAKNSPTNKEEKRVYEIAASSGILGTPDAVVMEKSQERFKEAHLIEHREQIASIRTQISDFATVMIKALDQGDEVSCSVKGMLEPEGGIYQLLKQLCYLGDVESAEKCFHGAGLSVEEFLKSVQAEYDLGLAGAIPMMVNMIAHRKFAGIPYTNYDAVSSLAFLQKRSDLGEEKSADHLAFAYRYNFLGSGAERISLDLTEKTRKNGIKSLAEKGNYYALMALGFVACTGSLAPEIWKAFPGERVRLFMEASSKEQKGRPLQWIDKALEANRVGIVPLGLPVGDRMSKLYARASLGNTKAVEILQRAYLKGFLGNESIGIDLQRGKKMALAIALYDEGLLCRDLGREGKEQKLRSLAQKGSKPAKQYLSRFYQCEIERAGLVRNGQVDREKQNKLLMDLANDGCEETRLLLLRILASHISTETLLSWALTGSEKSVRLYIDRCEERVKPNMKILFTLLFAVK